MRSEEWWVDFYDDSFTSFSAEKRSPEELEELAGFLAKILRLKKGGLLFDQCCGEGVMRASTWTYLYRNEKSLKKYGENRNNGITL